MCALSAPGLSPIDLPDAAQSIAARMIIRKQLGLLRCRLYLVKDLTTALIG